MILDTRYEKVQCEASQLKKAGQCPNFFYRKAIVVKRKKKYCSIVCCSRAGSAQFLLANIHIVREKRRVKELKRLKERYG